MLTGPLKLTSHICHVCAHLRERHECRPVTTSGR